MQDYNSQTVIPTLKQVVAILEVNHIDYRFLGSVVLAGINGKLHRNLGDLDLLIDNKGTDILSKELQKIGYKKREDMMFSFARKYLSIETFIHTQLSEVGCFHGTWLPDGSFRMGSNRMHVRIDAYAVKKTAYSLHNVSFSGIPERSAATGVAASASNPKRKKERELLKVKKIHPYTKNYIHVTVFNIRVDWIYHCWTFIFNVLGAIRVKFGLAFDPWR